MLPVIRVKQVINCVEVQTCCIMKKYLEDESFLARWAEGKLSPEELAEFERSDEYKEFERINKMSLTLDPPPIDLDKSKISVYEKISFDKKRSRFIRLSIAASVSLLLAALTVFFSSKTYETSYGEQLTIVLPDGSTVSLNAESELSYRRFFWLDDKKVILDGEAYFDIEKGDGFSVETAFGVTSVLGTEFNIRARKNQFSLACYEGLVEHARTKSRERRRLKAGTRLSIIDDEVNEEKTTEAAPNWMSGINVFNNVPLSQVIEELEIQFGLEFQINNQDISKLFSGSFAHDSVEKALLSTLTPMGIKYEFDIENRVVVLK